MGITVEISSLDDMCRMMCDNALPERPDPPYCRTCRKTEVSKAICDRCVRMHEEGVDDEM